MNRTRTIVRTCSLLTVLMLVGCARPSLLSSDPGSTSAIAMCGGGLDDGVTAAVEAEFERLSVRGITEFRRSVKAILNANDVSNEKYDRYIKCVLEIHRVRLEVESDHKEAEACKDRCTSLDDSCQANNRKMFDVCISRELKGCIRHCKQIGLWPASECHARMCDWSSMSERAKEFHTQRCKLKEEYLEHTAECGSSYGQCVAAC